MKYILSCYAIALSLIFFLFQGNAYSIELKDMVLVPDGEFMMGSPETAGYPREEQPRHRVNVSEFHIQSHEVTNREFSDFLNEMLKNPEFLRDRESLIVIRNDLKKDAKKDWWPADILFDNNKFRPVPGFEDYPVLSVSWYAADAYCRKAGGRLPTEAEWEKAARGKTGEADYPWGNVLPGDGIVFNIRWANNQYPAPVEPVKSSYRNSYGLYHVSGNVAEWCADWYDPGYYRSSPTKDPKGPDIGNEKVIRGGSWASSAQAIRITFRNYSNPGNLPSGVGFRCVKGSR